MANVELKSVEAFSLQSTDGTEVVHLNPKVCYRVGRLPKAEIVIRGSSASRLHAVVVHDGKRWLIQDMSSNGTLINRAPAPTRHPLQSGDVVRFGDVSEWVFMVEDTSSDTVRAQETVLDPAPLEHPGFVPLAVGLPIIVGTSSITSGMRFHCGKAALKSTGVIIRGELGTGKRHLARFIHTRSENRSKDVFIADASKLTARAVRRFFNLDGEAGNVGTVVLDEFLRMPSDAQSALLSYFEELSTLGADASVSGPRLISLTSGSPEKSIDGGEFRSELYFKLGVAQIIIDPLRDHVDDIPELTAHFGRLAAEQLRCPQREFSESTLDLMRRYRWPANLAELKNVVERAIMLARGTYVERGDLVAGFGEMLRDGVPYAGFSLEQVEKEHIDATLTAQRWVKSHVAKTLGIERSTLDRKIAKFGLARDGQSSPDEDMAEVFENN